MISPRGQRNILIPSWSRDDAANEFGRSKVDDFKGKVAFITGGGSGAALGQAKVFSQAGCRVAIADIRQDHLDSAMAWFKKERPGATIHPIHLDITDRKAYAAAADETEKVLGPVQLLFGTAGVNMFGSIERATYDDWDWQWNVNFNGVLNGMQTFVPRMIDYGKGGYIVNTASMAAFNASSAAGIYSVSKFAVRALCEAYRDALKKYNIGVSCLCPGNINSNIAESFVTRPKGMKTGIDADPRDIAALRGLYAQGIDPEELARMVMAAMKEDRFLVIPGAGMGPRMEESMMKILDFLPPADSDPQGVAERARAMSAYRAERAKLDAEKYGK
jgi:NAD(P)-dependent dehydrogenase (short-subunit alcohol dehydrogenase family)